LQHRDIKPENLLMTSSDRDDWTVKVSDFGLVKMVAEAGAACSRAASLVTSPLVSPRRLSRPPSCQSSPPWHT